MVGDEERAPLLGNIVAAFDAYPIERVRGEPEKQPQQGVGQQNDYEDRRNQSPGSACEKDSGRAEAEHSRHKVISPRSQKDSDKGKKIRSADDATLSIRARTMLDQGVDRYDEESGEEAQQREVYGNGAYRETRPLESRSQHRHADGTQGHEPVFNLVSREVSGGETPHADADLHCRLQIAILPLQELENVRAVENDVELQQGRKKEKVGIADYCQKQNAVLADLPDLTQKIRKEVELKLLGDVGCGDPLDPEAAEKSQDGEPEQNGARPRLPSPERSGHRRPCHRAGNDCEKGPELQDSIAPRETLLGEELRQQTVFRRPEKGALRAQQEHSRQRMRQAVERQARDGDQHHQDFGRSCPDGHRALAVAVRQVTAGHGEQDEREREEGPHDQHQAVPRIFPEAQRGDPEDHQELVSVVVERTLELRENQEPEAAPPGFVRSCRVHKLTILR